MSSTTWHGVESWIPRRRTTPTCRCGRSRIVITLARATLLGSVVYGTMPAPWPSSTSDAMRRTPSISAVAHSRTPERAAATSMALRSAVPGAWRRRRCSATSAKVTSRRSASGWPAGVTSTRSSSKSGMTPSSGSSTGRASTAASSAPDASWGSSDVVVAEVTTSRTLGWRACSATTTRGSSQRAVVGMTPRRTSPATSAPSEATSARRASSSAWIRRPRDTTTWPASVRVPWPRSTSVTPSSRSSRATCAEMFDCTVNRDFAAAEKVRWSATATREASCRRSMMRGRPARRAIAGSDGTYQ